MLVNLLYRKSTVTAHVFAHYVVLAEMEKSYSAQEFIFVTSSGKLEVLKISRNGKAQRTPTPLSARH